MADFTEDEDFGAQIRAARALLYITQGELARAARLSIATLNEIEHGKARKRASTREALLHCLASAGVHFERDTGDAQGQLFGVFLHRTLRPFHLTASIQNLLSPDALIAPRAMLFYIASIATTPMQAETVFESSDSPSNNLRNNLRNRIRLAVEVDFSHRRVLLDLAGFDLSPLRAAHLGRFLLSAFSLYGDRLFCSDPARIPTLNQSSAEAIATLARCERRALHDPFPLLFALEEATKIKAEATPSLDDTSLQDFLKQRDHPLARVKELIEAAQDHS